jgi:hypothetical protein
VVSLLLTKGAQVNLVHTQGGSALMEAATVSFVDVVRLESISIFCVITDLPCRPVT